MTDEEHPATGDATVDLEVCRACLIPTDDLRSIFKEGMICGQVTKLADMLASCTNLEVRTQNRPLQVRFVWCSVTMDSNYCCELLLMNSVC